MIAASNICVQSINAHCGCGFTVYYENRGIDSNHRSRGFIDDQAVVSGWGSGVWGSLWVESLDHTSTTPLSHNGIFCEYDELFMRARAACQLRYGAFTQEAAH